MRFIRGTLMAGVLLFTPIGVLHAAKLPFDCNAIVSGLEQEEANLVTQDIINRLVSIPVLSDNAVTTLFESLHYAAKNQTIAPARITKIITFRIDSQLEASRNIPYAAVAQGFLILKLFQKENSVSVLELISLYKSIAMAEAPFTGEGQRGPNLSLKFLAALLNQTENSTMQDLIFQEIETIGGRADARFLDRKTALQILVGLGVPGKQKNGRISNEVIEQYLQHELDQVFDGESSLELEPLRKTLKQHQERYSDDAAA